MRFVPAESLVPGMVMGRDIISTTAAFMLKKGTVLTEKYIEYIKEKGYLGTYISDRTSDDIVYEEIVDQRTFRNGLEAVENQNVGAIVNVATDIVADITSKKDLSVDLLDLRSYDDYTYHHSVNVAVYAVAVGKKYGLKDDELKLLSQAGLCHDLGKSRISEDIVNKPGKLTDEEYKEIQNHPRYSFDILADNNEVSSVVRQAVLYHHENENGTGYPTGKDTHEIPLFAKIIHCVDVYDALTSKRPYKDPFAPADAFTYINNGKGILFDPKIVDIMSAVIPAYPPGIDVVLSNGETALVVAHTDDAFRPILKIHGSEQQVNLALDKNYKDIYITESSIMPQDYVGEIETLNEDRSAVRKRNANILVVDDQVKAVLQIRDALYNEKYSLITLNSGVDAVKFIENNSAPDLIIMAIEMPILDGVTAAKLMRNLKPDLCPIIFMSSNSSVETILKVKKLGKADFILKPINPIYLKERILVALKESTD